MIKINTVKKHTKVLTVVMTRVEGYHLSYNFQKFYDIYYFIMEKYKTNQNNTEGITFNITKQKL